MSRRLAAILGLAVWALTVGAAPALAEEVSDASTSDARLEGEFLLARTLLSTEAPEFHDEVEHNGVLPMAFQPLCEAGPCDVDVDAGGIALGVARRDGDTYTLETDAIANGQLGAAGCGPVSCGRSVFILTATRASVVDGRPVATEIVATEDEYSIHTVYDDGTADYYLTTWALTTQEGPASAQVSPTPAAEPPPASEPDVAMPETTAEPGPPLAAGAGATVELTGMRRVAGEGPSGTDVATGVVIGGLLALFLIFPAELFDKTLEENWEGLRARLARRRRWWSQRIRWRIPVAAQLVAVIAVTSMLYALLAPGSRLDATTWVVGISTAVALATVTFLFDGVDVVAARSRGSITVEPRAAAIAIAAVCVAVSRLLQFEPGYLYGFVAGLAMAGDQDTVKDDARRALIAVVAVLGLALAAIVGRRVMDVASDTQGLLLLVDTVLATTTVVALEGLLFGLLPMRFLDGHRIYRYSRGLWAASYVLVAATFFAVIQTTVSRVNSVLVAAVLFLAFGAVSVGFWLYCRNRTFAAA